MNVFSSALLCCLALYAQTSLSQAQDLCNVSLLFAQFYFQAHVWVEDFVLRRLEYGGVICWLGFELFGHYFQVGARVSEILKYLFPLSMGAHK